MVGRWLVLGISFTLAAACGGGEARSSASDSAIAPDRVTDAVTVDADDPSLWLHPSDLSRSLIIGTNKAAAPAGALVVFGLDGVARQTVAGIDRPNNVDVEQSVTLDGRVLDVAVVTERLQHRLRVYEVAADGSGIRELGAVAVLEGQTGHFAEPMGVSLFKRPGDGALFAIVAPKLGPGAAYLWQYRIAGNGLGGVNATLVRRFGNFSGKGAAPGEAGEIEAVVVDDALGYVYYADERHGIHKWHADPDHPEAARELAVFGLEGYQLDREGLAIYARPDGTGYLVSTDQIPGGSIFKLYPREGVEGRHHEHPVVAEARTTADATDGIEVTATPLPGFPHGLLVAMNSGGRNFGLFGWDRLFCYREFTWRSRMYCDN